MKTVDEAIDLVLENLDPERKQSTYDCYRKNCNQLRQMAKERGAHYPCQELFDAFARDDHGCRSRKRWHQIVLKRVDHEADAHLMRLDYRPFNDFSLPCSEDISKLLSSYGSPGAEGISIGVLIAKAQSELEDQHYKKCSVVDDYIDAMQTFYCYSFGINGNDEYHGTVLEQFQQWTDDLLSKKLISEGRWYTMRKAASILGEIAETNHFHFKTERYKVNCSITSDLKRIRGSYELSLISENLSKDTVRNHLVMFDCFVTKMNPQTIDDLSALTVDDLFTFLSRIREKHDRTSLKTIYARVRRLMSFLYEAGYISTDLSKSVMPPAVLRENTAGYLAAEDMGKLYDVIDKVSLRDKAIFLVAAELGLRDYDISHLRFDQIDWSNDQIHIVQHKTNVPLTLPLTNNVGNAIMDYLQNERPVTDPPIPYIFLTEVAPYRRLGHAYRPCRKLLDQCGIVPILTKHRGTHLLRYSLIHRMLSKEITHQIITDSLGHEDRQSDKSYITTEPEMLRKCSLDLSLIGQHHWKEGDIHEF